MEIETPATVEVEEPVIKPLKPAFFKNKRQRHALSKTDHAIMWENIRKDGLKAASYPEEYQTLVKLVGPFGKDIKHRRGAETEIGARKIAKQRKLLLKTDEDVDGDEVDDIVLYDYDGRPVIYNGYEIVKSERPYRQKFRELHPTKLDRARVGGFAGFKKTFFDDVPDARKFVEDLKPRYNKWVAPENKKERKKSVYQMFTSDIIPIINDILIEELGDRSHMKSAYPMMSLIPSLYAILVLYHVWSSGIFQDAIEQIKAEHPNVDDENDINARYTKFVALLRGQGDGFRSFYESELSPSIAGELLVKVEIRDYIQDFVDKAKTAPSDSDVLRATLSKSAPSSREILYNVKVARIQLGEETKDKLERLKLRDFTTIFGEKEEVVAIKDLSNEAYQRKLMISIDALARMPKKAREANLYGLIGANQRKAVEDMYTLMHSFDRSSVDKNYFDLLKLFEEVLMIK